MADKPIDFECPECNGKVHASIDDVAAQKTVTCPNGHSIKLQDEGGGFRKVKKSMDDMERKIRDFGKR